MRNRKMAYALGAVLAVSVPMTAGAATVNNSFVSDADNNFTGSELARAEARWGDNPGGQQSTWELGVTPGGNSPSDEANINWPNSTFDWSLSFNGSDLNAIDVTFSASGTSVNDTYDLSGAGDILLRLVSGENGPSIDWDINGTAVTGDTDANYYSISGVDYLSDTLSGKGNMVSGTAGSRPGVQFKITDADAPGQSIPVPASIGLLGVGLMALGVAGRRRQKAS